jgi:hypothetical protein
MVCVVYELWHDWRRDGGGAAHRVRSGECWLLCVLLHMFAGVAWWNFCTACRRQGSVGWNFAWPGGVLFGTTGGVMEAALRIVYEVVSVGIFPLFCCVRLAVSVYIWAVFVAAVV